MKARAIAQAVEGGVKTALRVGGSDGEMWLDLGRKDWLLIKVTAEDWEEFRVGFPGVAFIRKPGMAPLPIPERGGEISKLRKFLNLPDDNDFALQVGLLLGWLRPKGPYPVETVTGVSNSGKTTTCTALRKTVDPNHVLLRAFKDEDDMFITAFHNWI